LIDSGWLPDISPGKLALPSRRASELLRIWTPHVTGWLRGWEENHFQAWCLSDVWHDHLLFEGEQLTGLIDYGEIKLDHRAVDLARMLGSLVSDNDDRWEEGLQAYRTVLPLTERDAALSRVLDRTGVVLGASNWLRWLYYDRRQFDNLDAVARRLTELVERMERWQGVLLS